MPLWKHLSYVLTLFIYAFLTDLELDLEKHTSISHECLWEGQAISYANALVWTFGPAAHKGQNSDPVLQVMWEVWISRENSWPWGKPNTQSSQNPYISMTCALNRNSNLPWSRPEEGGKLYFPPLACRSVFRGEDFIFLTFTMEYPSLGSAESSFPVCVVLHLALAFI